MIKHIAAAVAALVLVATGIFSYRAGVNATLADQARDEARMAEVEKRAERGAAKAIAANKAINRTIYNEVQRETFHVPDYSQCHHSADGLRNINAALTNQPLPAGDRELPGADPAP